MAPMSKFITACVISLTIGSELAAYAVTLPTLPLAQVDVTMPTVTGTTYPVTSCGTVQSTINTAAAADLTKTHAVDILASLSCAGTFTLPSRSGATGWLLIRSASYATLPAAHTRVGLGDLTNMPTFTGATTGVFVAATGASHYRFIGLSLLPAAATTDLLIDMGQGKASTGYFIVDRCILRDTGSSHQTKRAIWADARLGNTALVDSYISGIKYNGSDSQAWLSITNPGPILIRNNFMEAAGENMMLCGADPFGISTDQTYLPKNVTVQQNTMSKDPAWLASTWQMKTIFELKCGLRVLVEGNIFENMRYNQAIEQSLAFRLTPRNDYASSPNYIEVSDITIRYNIIRNVASWINSLPSDDGTVYSGAYTNHSKRWDIHDNLVYGLGNGCSETGAAECGNMFRTTFGGADGTCFDWVPGGTCKLQDFRFAHNTVDHVGDRFWCVMAPNNERELDVSDNIFVQLTNSSEVWDCNSGTAGTGPISMLNTWWSSTWTWDHNTMYGATNPTAARWPQGNNVYVTTIPQIGFSNRTCTVAPCAGSYLDYQLASNKNTASDGTDRGVNFTALNAALAGGSSGDLMPPAPPQNLTVR